MAAPGILVGELAKRTGSTAALASIEASLRKETGAEVIYDDDPTQLIERLLTRYESPGYICPCWPSGADPGRR